MPYNIDERLQEVPQMPLKTSEEKKREEPFNMYETSAPPDP